jgi:hypothetical protein
VCEKGKSKKFKSDKELFIFLGLEGDEEENMSKGTLAREGKGIREV